MRRVDGKVALITGGAKGIGSTTCELLADEGATVAIADVDDDPGRELAERLRARGAEARYWHLDVCDEDEVRRVFAEVAEEWGKLDILVNNAGIAGTSKPTDEVTLEEWER